MPLTSAIVMLLVVRTTCWNERIRVGAYLGRSKNNASNVVLVLNLQTGHISPQFHAAFDDHFEIADCTK